MSKRRIHQPQKNFDSSLKRPKSFKHNFAINGPEVNSIQECLTGVVIRNTFPARIIKHTLKKKGNAENEKHDWNQRFISNTNTARFLILLKSL